MSRKAVSAVYQIKITLQGIKPPIWRRVLVPADITLARLHFLLQCVMGWEGGHLHMFEVDGQCYGEPEGEFGEVVNEARVKLSKVLCAEKERTIYEYDFGDSWRHKIVLEKFCQPVRASPCQAAWQARALARPKIAAAHTAMPVCWPRWLIQNTKSMKTCANGSATILTRRCLMLRMPINT